MKSRQHKMRLISERLEDRLALATLINPTTLTYQDLDGDQVTVRFSRPILTSSVVANAVFDFSVGSVNGNNLIKQQLRQIDLGPAPSSAGTNVTVTATASNTTGGDGLAAVGEILANLDLGAVNIDGDLGRILAGDGVASTTGVANLTVHSIGRYGTSTGAANLESVIQGRLGALDVKTDVKNAFVDVTGGAAGSLGLLRMGGSILGGGTASSGRIRASGDVTSVNIRGSILGGTGNTSGRLSSSGKFSNVVIAGSIVGGSGQSSGTLYAEAGLESVRVGRDLLGGSGGGSGRISVFDSVIRSIHLGGSVVGGQGAESGTILSLPGAIGSLTIGGNLTGGLGDQSGRVVSSYSLENARIHGSIIGGFGVRSGAIAADRFGTINVGGSVVGGVGFGSGAIGDTSFATQADSLTIGGSLVGGDGSVSGSVTLFEGVRTARIAGDIIGGDHIGSTGTGYIDFGGTVNSLTVSGSVIGQSASASGAIRLDTITNLSIGGNIKGGNGTGSNSLSQTGYVSARHIGTMTLGGSLIAGIDDTTASYSENAVISAGTLRSLTVRGSVLGNTTARPRITATGNMSSTITTSDIAIETLRIDGSMERGDVLIGYDFFGVGRNADAQVGSVRVGGSWIASNLLAGASAGADNDPGNADDTKISGAGVKDIAGLYSKINSIAIGGSVLGSVGGSDHFGIVAEVVGTLRIGTRNFALNSGKSNDDTVLGITGDFRVNEI